MRYPSLKDFLRIAARLLEVDVADVGLFVRLDRAHVSLSPPTKYFARGRDQTLAEHAVQLFIDVAGARALPEKNLQCAWLCLKRFIELNAAAWEPQHGDQEAFMRFVEEINVGVGVKPRFVAWVESHLAGTDMASDEPPSEAASADPSVYLTSRISCLSRSQRTRLEHLSNAIDEEIAAFAAGRRESLIATYRPAVLPATDSTDPVAVLAGIEERLLDARGFVVLGEGGGSIGSGAEVAVAISALLPILYLQPEDEAFSPRTESLLNRYGACVRRYPAGDHAEVAIRSHVRHWLKREGPALVDGKRQREMAELRLRRLFDALRHAVEGMSRVEFARRLARVGMTEAHGRTLLSDCRRLLLGSVNELLALAGAFDVPANLDVADLSAEPRRSSRDPERERSTQQDRSRRLSLQELDDLEQLAAIEGYCGDEVARMISCAQASIDDELTHDPTTVGRRSVWTRQRWRVLHDRLS
jgi:hypothetical protein